MPLFRRRRVDVMEPSPPGPMAREEVVQRLLAAAPQAGPYLVDRLRPAVRYATRREPDAAIDVARSKIGGAPDLPRGTAWPVSSASAGEQVPLQFFAQLDLAEAGAAAPAPTGLPEAGQLSFFADFGLKVPASAEARPARILYSPPEAPFVRCALRLVPLPTAELAPVGRWSWPAPNPVDAGVAAFTREYEASLERQVPPRFQVTGRHEVGGYPAAATGTATGLGEDEVAVLVLDSDETLEMVWAGGAGGALVWTLRAAELAAGDWAAASFRLLPA